MTGKRLFAVRGAITLNEDTREQVETRTQTLLKEVFSRNDIEQDDIVSIFFTVTDDVHSEFPATAARRMGLNVPLLCAREMDADSPLALPLCIRVLVHHYAKESPTPVYLEDAARLTQLP